MDISVVTYAFVCLIATALIIIYALRFRTKKSSPELPCLGTFVINHDDPNKDLCMLALEQDSLEEIEKNKVMLIKIEVINDSGADV